MTKFKLITHGIEGFDNEIVFIIYKTDNRTPAVAYPRPIGRGVSKSVLPSPFDAWKKMAGGVRAATREKPGYTTARDLYNLDAEHHSSMLSCDVSETGSKISFAEVPQHTALRLATRALLRLVRPMNLLGRTGRGVRGAVAPQFGQFVDINSGRESTLFGQKTMHV